MRISVGLSNHALIQGITVDSKALQSNIVSLDINTADILAVLQGALVRNDFRVDSFYDNDYSFIPSTTITST